MLTAGRVYTVSTTGGTVNETDIDPIIEGIQIRAAAATETIDIIRPSFGQTSTITVADVVGLGRISYTQVYTTTAVRRIDFNGATGQTETTDGPWIGVQADLISGMEALGWLNVAAANQDRGIPGGTVTSTLLYRDSAQAEATFRIAVDAVNYDLLFYTGDRFAPSHVDFSVENGAFTATSALTSGTNYATTTLLTVSDQDADGFIDITFSHAGTSSHGFVNGFDIATAGNLPAALTLLAETVGAGADSLDAATLDAVVDQAIADFEAAGLDNSQINALRQVTFTIEDLGGRVLGLATGSQVVIDDDAAGHGWSSFDSSAGYEGMGGMDLLSAVLHELGHTLGHDDDHEADGSLMDGTLSVGEQRTADSLFMGEELFDYFD
jgi:hypothetical protein